MASPRWPGPEYRIRLTIHAPLDFVYSWCTDFSPKDAKLEGEEYVRKILSRTKRQVVFEDLEEADDGYFWSRDVVTLFPPDRWHMEGLGSHRDVTADYRLRSLSPHETEFELRLRRRPRRPGVPNPGKARWERVLMAAWRKFRTAMESEYNAGRSRRRN